jgi:hypothetical protein
MIPIAKVCRNGGLVMIISNSFSTPFSSCKGFAMGLTYGTFSTFLYSIKSTAVGQNYSSLPFLVNKQLVFVDNSAFSDGNCECNEAIFCWFYGEICLFWR